MSISLERDNRLPSSVFRKSSRQPEEREVAAELPQGDPTLAGPASQGVGCCPSGREVGGTLSGLLYPENKPPMAAGASALQKLPSQPSQLPRGADLLPAARRASGLSQGQGHTVKELLIPCMTLQSIFCPPHPLLENILPPRMQEITRITGRHLLESVQGTDAVPLWYLRAGDCSPEGWLRGEQGSHMPPAQCRTPSWHPLRNRQHFRIQQESRCGQGHRRGEKDSSGPSRKWPYSGPQWPSHQPLIICVIKCS